MTVQIFATAVTVNDDGYCTLLGFADDPENPVSYLILDMANEPDEQDVALGLGGIHLDAGELSVGGYDQIEDIRKTDSGIVVNLTAEAAERGGLPQAIEILFERSIVDESEIDDVVQRFRARLP